MTRQRGCEMWRVFLLIALPLFFSTGCDDQSKSDNADSTPIEVHCAAQGKMLTSTTVKVDCPTPP
jgi:hypothetical protein